MKIALRNTLPSLLADWPVPSSLFRAPLLNGESFDFSLPQFSLDSRLPSANVVETPKEFKLEMAAPGLERKDFNIEVDNHCLTISAEKKEEKKDTEGDFTRREYSYNSFSRSFTLPENVKENEIDAKYANGILEVRVPKAQETPAKNTKKIAVS